MLREGIYSLLAADAALQALLGDPTIRTDNIPGILPTYLPAESPLPSIVVGTISGHENDTMDGRGELRVQRLQITAYGATLHDAAYTADAAKDVLLGYQGTLNEGTEVDHVGLVMEADKYEPVPKVYTYFFDVEIWFRPPAA